MPWKDLEDSWFIAKAKCVELRIPLWKQDENHYYNSPSSKERFKLASCNSLKITKTLELIEKHKDDKILIIWEYIEQLEWLAKITWIALITWKIKPEKREEIFEKFRIWEISKIILSRVANFAIDLPDANVLIQISWLYGSRQEEAQRLWRILRPKKGKNEALFYSIVSNDTVELHYFEKRQLFLIEQWYEYDIIF
jgi:DNA excision repair protein ERCC-3